MKTPIYETSPGALSALLATRNFVFTDLYTFQLANGPGSTLRYTTADIDVAFGGSVWAHGGPLFDQASSGGSRPVAHWKVGLDVDTWQVVVAPRLADPISGAAEPDVIGSTPWLQGVRAGFLDGCVVNVDRAYLPVWPNYPVPGNAAVPTGVIRVFAGRVAEIDLGRTSCAIVINSHLELLNLAMPRNLYSAACRHVLFDAGCQLSAAAFAVGASVRDANSVQSTVWFSGSPTPGGSGTFALGRLLMTSGRCQGLSRSIRVWDQAGFGAALLAPLPLQLEPGDTCLLYPGCDKTQAQCAAFGNSINHGGFPYIPSPETAA